MHQLKRPPPIYKNVGGLKQLNSSLQVH